MHWLSSHGFKPTIKRPTAHSIKRSAETLIKLSGMSDWLLGRTALPTRPMLIPDEEKSNEKQAANVEEQNKIITHRGISSKESSDKHSNERTLDIMATKFHGIAVFKLSKIYSHQTISDHIVNLTKQSLSEFDSVMLQCTIDPKHEGDSIAIRILSSLCLELLMKRPQIFHKIRELNSIVRQAISTRRLWAESILFLYLKRMLCSLPHCAVICVLEMTKPLKGQKTVLEIIGRLNTLTEMTETGMRLLVTVPESTNAPSGFPDSRPVAQKEYTELVTKHSILLSSLVQSRPALAAVKEKIASFLGRFADFQLGECYLQYLARSQGICQRIFSTDDQIVVSPRDILKLLMPTHLMHGDSMYGHEWVTKAIMWLSVCIRPLSLSELATALAVECSENGFRFDDSQIPLDIEHDLSQALPGLVRIEDGMVELAHPDFRDLIVQDQGVLPSWCRKKSSHSEVAACCLWYLNFWGLRREYSKPLHQALVEPDSLSWPLVQYAAEYWFQHHAKAFKTALLGSDFPTYLLADPKTMDNWVEQYLASKGSIGQISRGYEGFTPLQLTEKYRIDIPTAIEIFLYARTLLECQTANDVIELLCVATEFGFAKARVALRMYRPSSNVMRETHAFYKVFQAGMSSAFVLLADANPAFVVEHSYELLMIDIRQGNGQVLVYLDMNSSFNDITVPVGSTPLHEACQLGHLDIVKRLTCSDMPSWLEKANEPDGYTPLHLAVLYGHSDVVEELLNHHANPNAVNSFGETPLITATRLGLLSIVSILLQNNTTNSGCSKDGQTSLHIASTEGYGKICSLLIRSGLSIYAKDQRGDNSLHLALKNGQNHLVERFLAVGRDGVDLPYTFFIRTVNQDPGAGQFPSLDSLDGEGNTPLTIAIENHFEAAAQLLISSGADLNVRSNHLTPLMQAAQYGSLCLVRSLLANQADPKLTVEGVDGGGGTALHVAAFFGHKETAQELIGHANMDILTVDDIGNTALRYALDEGHSEVSLELLKHCSTQVDLNNLILAAAQLNNEKPITRLLDAGADKNFQDHYGSTALHCASHSDCSEVVRALLSRYVQLELKDIDGNTALSDAARTGSIKSLVMLLDAGADMETKNNEGCTPLHQAALSGNEEAVRILILRGAEM